MFLQTNTSLFQLKLILWLMLKDGSTLQYTQILSQRYVTLARYIFNPKKAIMYGT